MSKTSLKIYILAFLASLVVRFLHLTVRWRYEGLTSDWKSDTQKIIPFWHERLVMAFSVFRASGGAKTRKAYALTSSHKDGQLSTAALGFLGLHAVKGSSSRGAVRGMLQLIDVAKTGATIGLTPDGPRGPRRVLKAGVVQLAKTSGVPIYPLSYSTEKRWTLRSWDQMIIPKPFSRGVVFLGERIDVPEDSSEVQLAAITEKVTAELSRISDLADQYDYR